MSVLLLPTASMKKTHYVMIETSWVYILVLKLSIMSVMKLLEK